MAKAKSDTEYILGYDEAEYTRLEFQAKLLEPPTREALEAVGITKGWRCLDVACGTGAVTRLMGEMVGASGSVHAIDVNIEHVDATVARLKANSPNVYSTEQFDVTRTSSPRGIPYNLVFARLLICHMTDPVGTLKKMWSWVTPGGILLVQDYDIGVLKVTPSNALVEEGFEILQQCFARAGKDYRAGSSMPHYFQRASIGEHDGILFSCKSTPALKGQDMLFAVLKSLKMPAVKLGLKTEGEYDTFLNTLAASVPSTDSVMRRPDMISVWRKRAN